MSWNNSFKVGVIGAGTFGTALANLLALNNPVYLYVRNKESYENILANKENKSQKLHPNIEATQDLEKVCNECTLLYPVVNSPNFRSLCQSIAPYLRPDHLIIHGTKGLSIDVDIERNENGQLYLLKEQVHTMTEIIRQETIVLRVGCLSGPNLAMELAQNKPAATVIASRFNEVIEVGKASIRNDRFRVYGSNDVVGVELAGVLKNIIAIASGIAHGLGLGENARAMLMTLGLEEMIQIGQTMGSKTDAFYGIAGIGDLIATCSSQSSRNFSLGLRLAKGEIFGNILEDIHETTEGVLTTRTAYAISQTYGLKTPIIEAIYNILFEQASVKQSMAQLVAVNIHSNVVPSNT